MRASLALAVVAWALGTTATQAQESTRPSPPQIVTSGHGEVRLKPDRATIMIGVQTRAATAAAATAGNSRRQLAVITAIKAKGVAAEQISTSGFSVSPETVQDRTGQTGPKTTGYLVSNVVAVEVRNVDLVGTVIDAAILAGANEIHSLNFGVTASDSVRRVALGIAVANSRADADVAARAAGGSVGGLLELTTTEYETPFLRSSAYAGVARLAEVPIEPGQETIRARVTARWLFVPNR